MLYPGFYVYGLGLIGREDADGQYLSYHSDLRGSTTILTNEASQVTDRYTYGLYGELESHEGSTNQPFRYNGRDGVQTDPNGLYYMRARYYDPKLKRFLNRDVIQETIIDGQTFNRYAHVNGDPVSYIDPLGLSKNVGCESANSNEKIILSEKAKQLYEKGHYSQALDIHYEDMIRRKTGGREVIYGEKGKERELDSVTSEVIIEAKRSLSALKKPENFINKKMKKQFKATLQYAEEHDLKVEYWFKYGVHDVVESYLKDKGVTVRTGMGD